MACTREVIGGRGKNRQSGCIRVVIIITEARAIRTGPKRDCYGLLFPKIREPLVEPVYTSFQKLIESYVDLSCMFMKILLTGTAPLQEHARMTAPLQEHDRMIVPREIPRLLQADYRLLQLQAEDSPAQVRAQYRELAKLYHPDAGGHHADFLTLQQAYERVVQYQQTLT